MTRKKATEATQETGDVFDPAIVAPQGAEQ
jgi:hypothetical protein